MGIKTFTIHELAEITGVSSRTVRFYVQRGLIDAPQGRGRGSAYTQQHVEQILRVRGLQREGLALQAIQQLPEDGTAPEVPKASKYVPTLMLRIPLAPGIRLEIEGSHRPPDAALVDRLAAACERILEEQRAEEQEPDPGRGGRGPMSEEASDEFE